MNKIVIKLKQHTPLLHFQPLQDGAALRASEVKPQLDAFLLKELGKGNQSGVGIASDNKWLSGDSEALNYKMRIEPLGDPIQISIPTKVNKKSLIETNKFPMILSNMGGREGNEDVANLVMYNEYTVTLTFTSSFEKYEEFVNFLIEERGEKPVDKISRFIATHNFGQRTTKGFGSFTVSEIEMGDFKVSYRLIGAFLPGGTRFMKFKLNNYRDELDKFNQLFGVIDYYWKRLKSGINYKGKEYRKSFLYNYLNAISVPLKSGRVKINQTTPE